MRIANHGSGRRVAENGRLQALAFFEDPLTWGLIGIASVVGAWRGDGK